MNCMPLLYFPPPRSAGTLGLRVRYAAGDMSDNAYRKPNRFVARRRRSWESTPCLPNTRALRSVPVGRKPIRLALSICEKFRSRGDATELIDARTVGLPIMDRMYKEYALGEAPAQMEAWPRRSVRRTRSHSSSANTTGSPARRQEFHRRFPRGVIVPVRLHHKLFRRPNSWRARCARLVRYSL